MQQVHLLLLCIILNLHHNIVDATQGHEFEQNVLPTKNIMVDIPQYLTPLELPQIPKMQTADQSLDLFSYFLRPINFSKEGIAHYFKYTYNHEKYTQYLPYNFLHMIQFLEFGQQHDQNEVYAKSIIKLFLQKFKGCDFINAYAMISAMPKLADALQPYMQKKEASFLTELQKSLKARFSNIFSTYYSYFQKSPDAFLQALSEQIARKTNEIHTQQHIDVEHIKKDIVRFLETCISKLIWAPQDAYEAWIAINELANQTQSFLQKNLITDSDALDDVCWSLIHRFVYFIDISADEISQDVFTKIVHDIYNTKLILLEIDEQEDLMTNKKDYLLQKIKIYCPQALPRSNKEYKIFTAQNIVDFVE